MFKNADEVKFAQALGQYAEMRLAPELLRGLYDQLEYLGPTFPWADYAGIRYGRPWLISVKARFMWDQYESRKAGKLVRNPNYKLDGRLDKALEVRRGDLAWLTIPIDFTGLFEAYHGTVDHLRQAGLKGTGVPMSLGALQRNSYDALDVGSHTFDFEEHPNVWAYKLHVDWKLKADTSTP